MQPLRTSPLRSGLCLPWPWRPGRVLLAWVLAAWMLSTLAPGLSRVWQHWHASPAAPSLAWTEVCTSMGLVQAIPAAADGATGRIDQPVTAHPTDSGMPGGVSMDACALCVLAVDRLAPPLPPEVSWQGARAPAVVVSAGASRPWTDAELRHAYARGPPLTS